MNVFRLQPLNFVRDYFGEEMAFYFAWQGTLVYALWIPSIIGLIFFFIGISISISKVNSIHTTNSTNLTILK